MYHCLPPNITVSPTEATDLTDSADLEDLLTYLKQVQQIDLTGYKLPSLLRRVRLRMRDVRVEHHQDYLDYLKQQPDEVTHLLNTVYINFTSFFRDRPVWDHLENEVIPKIIASKAPDEPIRIWSAGCASGEETYSLAILLAEALGINQFQQRVRIYGSDVDSEAILQAQKGCYPSYAVEPVPPDLLEKYFEPTAEGYRWRRQLYHSIIFRTRNLIQAPPLPRIDLLVCRNMLMYLTSETQIRALVRFHFSLQPTGYLLIGQAENLVSHIQTSLFQSVHRQARIFTKVPNAHRNRRLLPLAFGSMTS
ncbi:protein-glutamate O-methyltransferase CheR [Oculatella sp. FACHB-28]|uniref:CheR family methyltransferase n=1 Tax=Oculatella sp. FACHB-28 TaxID=2692845 RepID=UPI001685AFFE|nr:protein-glutamate O-methyltransferase CheR [Oculatella sp. FACHB-28]MBD2057545.1 protein-glutamate O-methyltransferase CheR [Oculatella sp. FACHB-28]